MTDRMVVMVVTELPALLQMTLALLDAAGCSPILPSADENAVQAIRRLQPHAVMLDCEHPAAVSDRFFETAEELRVGVLVYGREPREADAAIVAQQQNVCRLALPVNGQLLAHAVAGARTR